MIQTTKDADKAKTSQRQRVDDQNDRFVSRNCHHAPHRSHVFWALCLSRFNGFADLLRDAQPGTAKGAFGYREAFGLADSLIFIPWPEGASAHIAIPFLRRLWTTQQSDKQPR